MKIKDFVLAFEIGFIIWVIFPFIACEVFCDVLEKYVKLPNPALFLNALGAFLIGFAIWVKFRMWKSILMVIFTQFLISTLFGILIFLIISKINEEISLSPFGQSLVFARYLIYMLIWIVSAILGWLLGKGLIYKKSDEINICATKDSGKTKDNLR
jgi:hypothetical protein